jgi:hypothetical protein
MVRHNAALTDGVLRRRTGRNDHRVKDGRAVPARIGET